MKKLKVMTVVGTRPEIIRLSRVIAKLDQFCDHVIVHTGQNYDYELNQIFFEDLGIRNPDYFLNSAGASAAETIGNVIGNIDKFFVSEKPDALLVPVTDTMDPSWDELMAEVRKAHTQSKPSRPNPVLAERRKRHYAAGVRR